MRTQYGWNTGFNRSVLPDSSGIHTHQQGSERFPNRINSAIRPVKTGVPVIALLLMAFIYLPLVADPIAPIVSNVTAVQRTDGSKIVDIYYDLFDANNDLCTISLQLSTNGGSTFAPFINPANLSGDLGLGIANGTSKHIIWNAFADNVDYDANQYVVRVTANDNTIADNFAYVPSGTFLMGDTHGGGNANESPVHNVNLNSFLISKYEVTQSEWQAIMGSNPANSFGIGPDYPVYHISWYSMIKYCNLRSIAENLTPCYTINGSTDPATWGSVPTTNNTTWNAVICNWNASGYRLPTEAEWEYAARGATNIPDYLYSGSDGIGSVAWYSENSGNTSHPVGTKSPNGISTLDMSGNVYELCWDWYSATYYSSSATNNPTGPDSGSHRVVRGGSWFNSASNCRVSYRTYGSPYANDYYAGFRICKIYP